MKLKKQELESIDLGQEGSETNENDPQFWDSIRELVRYGVPAYDKKGHWTEIRIRVRPMQVDMVAAVREKLPENWVKNQSSLYRALIAVGCKTMLKFLDMDKGEWDEVLMGLNQIAKKSRLDEFKQEMASLKNDVANGTMPTQEKVKVIDIVSKLERKITEM